MRKAPEKPPAPASMATDRRNAADEKIISNQHTYCFLTPVFGGGVQVEENKPSDPRTPVRVPSIRGQLRFWWRACNPSKCKTIDELWKREKTVFGSTKVPSALVVSIVKQPTATRDVAVLKDRFAVVDNRLGRAYGAFPLRDSNQGTNHGVLHEHSGDWIVAVSYPEPLENDIEAAFWAWAHFGGLGGRTRRGFGAIEERARGGGKRLLTIEEGWRPFVYGERVSWPHLQPLGPSSLRAKGGWQNGPDAQEYLLDIMRKLRQVDVGRKRTADDVPGNHPGRSYWPEPDTIRKLTGIESPDHRKPVTGVEAFPRAAFGLPIIFHFKDRRDPPDTTLVPCVKDKEGKLEPKGRLASPLILRPHRAANGEIEALALVLAHPSPNELTLQEKNKFSHPVKKWSLTHHEALHVGLGGRPSPFVTRSGTVVADPIQRFLEEIR